MDSLKWIRQRLKGMQIDIWNARSGNGRKPRGNDKCI